MSNLSEKKIKFKLYKIKFKITLKLLHNMKLD